MPLRRSPRLTPASLTARRTNALKSTGPRTEQGKARAALNPLQHGRYAVNLPDRLVRAGCRADAARWHAIRARIARTFEPTFGDPASGAPASGPSPETPGPSPHQTGPDLERKMDRLANWVWCSHRSWRQRSGAKLECRAESVESALRHTLLSRIAVPPAQIRIHNPWARLGLVFYAQTRRGWMMRQLLARIVGGPASGSGDRWENTGRSACATQSACATENSGRSACATENTGRSACATENTGRSDCATGNAGGSACATGNTGRSACATGLRMEPALETGLRAREYRLGRPRFWEQMRYCLDGEGNYHPEWRGPLREYRRMLRNSSLAMWLEPHPIRTALRQEAERQTAGVSGGWV